MAKNTFPRLNQVEPDEQPILIDATESLRNHILVTLGRPKDLIRIDVVRLWPNTYRANLLVGKSFDQATFAHSYFVTTTDAGKVVTSVPNLSNVYA
ncbi:hypothetical protein [Limnoglobus roseus]|uniref:Uncharacterized protein n=1 Tax=Limnoglobus roseus TaxID=2598579 RepID=A0A5C1ASG7_9BACT|nr:hypothetical protein [Limnoglobus roseus]QEL21097.1 hypothetical protein PX52LOC_08226 [Limnoglobus roseus]